MDIFTVARKNSGAIVWAEAQVAYIIDKYVNENYHISTLSKLFSCSPDAIRRLLRKNKIKLRGCKQGFPRNENYFENIDTSEKAYWLGFLYADGCVHSNEAEISLGSIDKEHIEKFKNAIGAINNKITVTQDTRFKNAKPIYGFTIRDKKIHNDLIKWGCIPQKSLKLETIPNIPRNYISHFIRGYFDGDGNIHYLKRQKGYRLSFTGTKSFLEEIKKELEVQKISVANTDSKCFLLQISGRKQVIRILNYLYKDSKESTRLNRKYNHYLNCLEGRIPTEPVNAGCD